MGRSAIIALVVVLMLSASACGVRGPEIRFVDDAKVYTRAEVEANASAMPAGTAAGVSLAESVEVRERTLARLRQEGATAGKAADFMTSEFPVKTQAVPYYVEAASVDGTPAWIIVEAWGGRTGKLTMRRLWVFARETGDVLDAQTYR